MAALGIVAFVGARPAAVISAVWVGSSCQSWRGSKMRHFHPEAPGVRLASGNGMPLRSGWGPEAAAR